MDDNRDAYTRLRMRPLTPADAASIASIYSYYVRHSIATFELNPLSAAEIEARLTQNATRGLPCIVCETERLDESGAGAGAVGEIVEYAYGRPYNAQRPGYDPTIELTVYLRHLEPVGPDSGTQTQTVQDASQNTSARQSWMGRGLGRRLVTELLEAIRIPLGESSAQDPAAGVVESVDSDEKVEAQHYLQVVASQARVHEPQEDQRDCDRKSFYTALGFRYVGTLARVGYKLGVWVDVDLWQLDLRRDDLELKASR